RRAPAARYFCRFATRAPPEHLRAPEHRATQPISALPSGRFAHREQPGEGRLSRGVDTDTAVARVMVQLDLDQVSPHIEPLGPHELDEQLREKAPLSAGQIEEHAVVCRTATGHDLALDGAVQVQSGIATAHGPVKGLES